MGLVCYSTNLRLTRSLVLAVGGTACHRWYDGVGVTYLGGPRSSHQPLLGDSDGDIHHEAGGAGAVESLYAENVRTGF